MKIQRLLSLALAAVFLLAAQSPALAQATAHDPERALLADFPPLSIDSVERAEEAIKRLPPVRDELTRRYTREKADCLERFFAASCLSDLRNRERKANKAVNRIEVEAKAFLRRERAAERDRIVAERERRAAEEGGKSIPYSGAARNHGRNGQGGAEGRDTSRRIQIERVPESAPEAGASPDAQAVTPAESGEAVPPNTMEPMPEPAVPGEAQVPAAPVEEKGPESPASSEAQPMEAQPTDAQPTDAQPTEAQPTEAQPTEAQPTEAQPTEAQPTEAQPVEARSPDSTGENPSPTEDAPGSPRSAGDAGTDAQALPTGPVDATPAREVESTAPAAAGRDGPKAAGDEAGGSPATPVSQ